ncbi:MAG: methionyl-tRNA formyltransferase [Verrucomicrobia bacterium]|nr:MAG: methionyl-tRNA formyltransferase [Verrucomicrobiota bacterium]
MRIVFIGTGEIGVPALSALLESEHEVVGVVTQPDKPAGRDQRLEAPPIKKALAGTQMSPNPPPAGSSFNPNSVLTGPTPPEGAGRPSRLQQPAALRALRGPILQPARIKDRESIKEIRALTPDVIVVMAYGQILPKNVLEIPPTACLNLHASLLPRHRGAAPIQAAIAAGDRETGITVMYMDEGLDIGDILLQRKIDILPNDTGGSLHDHLSQIAPEALLESLRMLASRSAPRIPQENALATYAPKLSREAGRINWSEPAETIERKIRAFNPWPGAFMRMTTKANELRTLKIFSAAIVNLSGAPGETLGGEKELIIAAGTGALSLLEVQLEGKRRMSAAEFLRGAKVDRPLRGRC